MASFEEWLRNFELNNVSKENRAYLPLTAIEALLPLKEKFEIKNKKVEAFIDAYQKKAKGDYKNLRTVSSGEDQPTWDIIRNSELKKLVKGLEEDRPEMWKDDLPTKEHMELILWGYSPDASKIKKNISVYEDKLGSGKISDDEIDDDDDEEEEEEEEKKDKGKRGNKDDKKAQKRKSSGDDSDDEESPKKKTKGD